MQKGFEFLARLFNLNVVLFSKLYSDLIFFFLIKKRNSLNLWFIINFILNFLSHIVIIIFWFIFRLQKDMKHYKSMWPCFSVSDGLYMYLILNMNKLWTKLNWKLKKPLTLLTLSEKIYWTFLHHALKVSTVYFIWNSKWNLNQYVLHLFLFHLCIVYHSVHASSFRNTRILLGSGLVYRWELLVSFDMLVIASKNPM